MGTRNDDISLILAKAKKQGFLPDVKDEEVDLLEVEARTLFGLDNVINAPDRVTKGESFSQKQKFKTGDINVGAAADSTWNQSTEALELWVAALATADSSLNVESNRYNVATQLYDAPVTIQAGTSPAPGIIFNDLFNRTAADLYGTQPDLGNPWAYDGSNALGDWSIDGTKAIRTADATGSVNIADGGDAIDSRVTINATVSTVGGGSARSPRILFSYLNSNNYLYMQYTVAATTGVVTWALYKRINGQTATPIATGSSGILTANTASVSATFILERNGLNASATINGTTITGTLTQSEVDYLAGGARAGVNNTFTAGDALLDFKIESITTLPPRKLTLWNGAVSGSTLQYQQDRLDVMYPVELDILLINSGHNYSGNNSDFYHKAIDSFIADFRAKQPKAGIVISSQNPQKSPASNRKFHFERQVGLRAYCARRGYGYIPAAEAFYAQTNNGLDMISTDGVHPIQSGSNLWRDTISTYFNSL